MAALKPGRRIGLSTLVAAAVLAVPVAATAGIAILPADQAPVELLEPLDGTVLEGGREAIVSWRPLRDLAADGIEEWEAFLSFDGGRSWPVRATPHLDLGFSSFRFVVPMAVSDDVRLMLRFGDERREVGFVMPVRLRATVPSSPPPVAPLPVLAFERGEPARPGDAGVRLWVDGGRDGRGLVVRSSAWTPPAVVPAGRDHLADSPAAVPPDPREREGAVQRPGLSEVTGSAPAAAELEPSAAVERSLLLLHCRRNE